MLKVPPFSSSSYKPPVPYPKTRVPRQPELGTAADSQAHHEEQSTFKLTVHSTDGNRWSANEDSGSDSDSDSSFTISESGFSEFRTIKTVTDYGLGQYAQEQVRKYSSPDGNPRESRGILSPEAEVKGEKYNAFIANEASLIGAHLLPEDTTAPRATETAFDDDLDAELHKEHSMDNVCEQLWSALATSKYCGDKTTFLPHNKLFTIVNDFAVQCILTETFNAKKQNNDTEEQDIDPEEQKKKNGERLAQICGDEHQSSRRMVFAILVMEENVRYIDHFIDNKIFDINLPVSWDDSSSDKHVRVRRPKGSELSTRCCFSDWDAKDLRKFCDNQYRVITPFLHVSNKEVYFYKMNPNIRLPFTEWEYKKKGGYGSISRVRIHKAHHGFTPSPSSDPNPVFAVKTVFTSDFENYAKEVRVLQRFSGSSKGHPHLIRLLMAFQHGMRLHLLFPWASGNLYDYWQVYQKPEHSTETTQWLINQCSGLAAGLAKVHNHHSWRHDQHGRQDQLGRHGDIKPLNILWFESFDEPARGQKDHLVIADFGLTIFHSSTGNTELTTANRLRGCSMTYRPPEVDLGNGKILQSYDVWSLACLYLEFVTWYLVGFEKTCNETQGPGDPITFVDHRVKGDPTTEDKFFIIRREMGNPMHEAVVKPEWVSDLREREDCPQCLVDFLDFIQNRMLLPVAHKRADMKEVNIQLAKIKDHCKDTPSYGHDRGPSILGRSARHATEVPATGNLRDSTTVDVDAEDDSVADLLEPEDEELGQALDEALDDQLDLAEPMSAENRDTNGDKRERGHDTECLSSMPAIFPGLGQPTVDQPPRRTHRYQKIPHLDIQLTTSTLDATQPSSPLADSAVMVGTPFTTQFSEDELPAERQDDNHHAPSLSCCASSLAAESSSSLPISPSTQKTSVPPAVPTRETTAEPTIDPSNYGGDSNAMAGDTSKVRVQRNRRQGRRAKYWAKAGKALRKFWNRLAKHVERHLPDDGSLKSKRSSVIHT
ncbi:kinase-like domain-containing protein [Apiospora arundinis]|uniref:Kinase-like domain-containing protein n=1 Tax=Apiospora arundinis TaxID=335852 RepID=A0ABR2IIS0_9PEZI